MQCAVASKACLSHSQTATKVLVTAVWCAYYSYTGAVVCSCYSFCCCCCCRSRNSLGVYRCNPAPEGRPSKPKEISIFRCLYSLCTGTRTAVRRYSYAVRTAVGTRTSTCSKFRHSDLPLISCGCCRLLQRYGTAAV